MRPRYDPLLVVMSITIAMLASYVALDLTERVTRSSGRVRAFWWLGGAIAMGVGIWSMHFVGMLALQLPAPVEYDVALVLLSVLVAIAASGLALDVASRPVLTTRILTISSLLMGGAISGMHYIGMAAMMVPLRISWRPLLILSSIAIAVVASFGALMSAFKLRRPEGRLFIWMKLGAAAVMGLAIVGMHYTAMAAARFESVTSVPHDMALSLQTQGLSVAVIAGTLTILGLALVGNQIGQLSERKQAETMLRDSERRYRYMFQTAGVSILEEDFSRVKSAIDDLKAEGVDDFRQHLTTHPEFVQQAMSMVTITDVNDATLKLFAAPSKNDVLVSLPKIFLPETHHAFAEELIAIAEGHTKSESETVVQTLNGEKRTVLFTITFPHQPATLDNVLMSVTDITERKSAEEALRLAQAELAHVTRVMTMGEMTASIAHEVNQPLSGVLINGNACLRWLASDPPNLDEAREAVLRMVRDGKRASEVIARVRTLSKKGSAEKAPLDINEAIHEVVALAQGEVRKNRVALRTALSRDLPRVLGDRVQLQQVVLNLMMNGIEAMGDVGDRPRELVIKTQREGASQVRVCVRDSGRGIDPQRLDRIFEAFYTTKAAGMGMGLSISRSIIENHGGRLWAVANDDPGTTFQFTV